MRQAVGVTATRTDEIRGRGAPDILLGARCFLEHRFGFLQVQGKSLARAGMGLAQNREFLPISPELRTGRKGPHPEDETEA